MSPRNPPGNPGSRIGVAALMALGTSLGVDVAVAAGPSTTPANAASPASSPVGAQKGAAAVNPIKGESANQFIKLQGTATQAKEAGSGGAVNGMKVQGTASPSTQIKIGAQAAASQPAAAAAQKPNAPR